MFYSVGIFRTSRLGDSISRNPERIAPTRLGEEPGYTEVLQQRADRTSKDYCSVENQMSQAKEFGTFHVWEDAGVWVH